MTVKQFINIDYSRDELLTDFGKQTLKDRYLLPHEVSPQDAFARAALAFSDTPEMAQRIYDYASKQWFGFSTPILSNAPEVTSWVGHDKQFKKARGLPISCFLNYVLDSRKGITSHYEENAFMASVGGGIGGSWSEVRADGVATSSGAKSTGVIPFIHVADSEMLAFSQGVTRRGSYAAYLDISHPEILEFIGMRKPSGGDIHRKCLNIHHGVNLSDKFMHVIEGCLTDPNASPDWDLIDPHSKEVVATVDARELWVKLIETRVATGEPYVFFKDTAQRALPEKQQEMGLKVHHSNLCTEITLPTNEDRTAVCCLSSVNLEKWEEWRHDVQFIYDLVRFLDNVLSYFIENAPMELHKAVHSALMERSIGLGAMGFHSLLQAKGLPFESAMAESLNRKMFRHIKSKAKEASLLLGMERGEAPDMMGTGLRNAHLLAIAPNASSSIICGGVSPSVEPIRANVFTQKTLSGSFTVKNKYLEDLLNSKGLSSDELEVVWKSISRNEGSVQHIPFLEDYEKEVFKTADEMDQMWCITHAAVRQPDICQAQSVNIFVRADEHVVTLTNIHFQAWKKGLKSLYYCRSKTLKRAEDISQKIDRDQLQVTTDEVCLSCEG